MKTAELELWNILIVSNLLIFQTEKNETENDEKQKKLGGRSSNVYGLSQNST